MQDHPSGADLPGIRPRYTGVGFAQARPHAIGNHSMLKFETTIRLQEIRRVNRGSYYLFGRFKITVSAYHLGYRISLRPSSKRAPNNPSLYVVRFLKPGTTRLIMRGECTGWALMP